ncbi:cytochrome P450 [Streptomyces sp. NPDC006784]|uniref:cytochrome P450 n=1 Tax=Streptomyces sp. NPDC006784 TaxID=3364764 RepID=UPI003699E82C
MSTVPAPGHPSSGQMPPPLSRPNHQVTQLYGEEFAADPYAVYDRLRKYGALAPVEIAPGVGAMLVIDYRAALDLLHDPATWSKDSSIWLNSVPDDSAVMPMLRGRPNALFTDGETHARYRKVIADSFGRQEPHEMRKNVQEVADSLIASFAADGEADLIGQFARVLPLLYFNRAFGLPDEESELLIRGIMGMFDGKTPEEAAAAEAAYMSYVTELTQLKQREPGQDLTSWFMQHPAMLSAEEIIHQIVLTLGASYEPLSNLIGNALSRMLVDDRYYGNLSGGALTARDALHDVLRNEPPMANYSAHYPRRDVYFHGVWLRAGQLVLVSYAAASTQSGRSAPGESTGAAGSGGGAHLAWAAGPHACPAQQPALLIATTAIERLTAWLSDIELTVPYDQLAWRPGPFQRGLVALPARFSPVSPDTAGGKPWKRSSRQSG